MNETLLNAYRWYRQPMTTSRQYHGGMTAKAALSSARADVERYNACLALDPPDTKAAARWRRYPASSPAALTWQPGKPGLAYVEKPENFGLRLVGRVAAETPRGRIWEDSGGWYCDAFQEGLCFGVVYQLPGRKGRSRFVAAYDWSEIDGGPTIELGRIYESDAGEIDHWNSARDCDAARTAARHADGLAQAAAEEERDYQTAWQAGSMFGEKGEEIATARKTALELLAELRAWRRDSGEAEFPLACKALRKAIAGHLETIGEARAERRKLASGQWESGSYYLGFYTGDADLRAAFCDGAGLTEFPR